MDTGSCLVLAGSLRDSSAADVNTQRQPHVLSYRADFTTPWPTGTFLKNWHAEGYVGDSSGSS